MTDIEGLNKFWVEKWESNKIGFHNNEVFQFLTAHIGEFNIQAEDRVFLPLCGKTLDIKWLMDCGVYVVGCEVSEVAVQALFSDMNLIPEVVQAGRFTLYHGPRIEIFVCDIFNLLPTDLGEISLVYDRAALIALPPNLHKRYSDHIKILTNFCKQMIITIEFDPNLISSPPYSVSKQDLSRLYKEDFTLKELGREADERGLKGKFPVVETCWMLARLSDAFPDLLGSSKASAQVLGIERTFWEKATILHMLCHQDPAKPLSDRMSRHYYDMALLIDHPAKERALENLDLLEQVAHHKSVYFKAAWARYETAKPGSLRLIPSAELTVALRRDYAGMKEMIIGPVPDFDDILSKIETLEVEVNG